MTYEITISFRAVRDEEVWRAIRTQVKDGFYVVQHTDNTTTLVPIDTIEEVTEALVES